MKGIIEKNSILVHVDNHLDDDPNGILVDNLFSIKTEEDVINVSRNYHNVKEPPVNTMFIDNFIWHHLQGKQYKKLYIFLMIIKL